MTKKLLIFCIGCLFASLCKAQTSTEQKVLQAIVQTDSINDNSKAILILDSVLKLPNLHTKNKVEAIVRLCTFYIKTQQLDKAITIAVSGVEIATINKFDTAQCNFYKNIGAINYYNNKYAQAIEYFFKSALLAQEKGILYLQVINYQNIGGVYIDFGKSDSAKLFLTRAIALGKNCGIKCNAARLTAVRLLGTLYQREKKFNLAQQLYSNGLTEAKLLNDTTLICSYLVFSAELYKQINNIPKAIASAEEALRLMQVQKGRNEHSFLFCLKFLANKYEFVSRYKEASAMYKQAIELEAGMLKKQNQQQVNELSTKFKVKELEQEKDLAKATAKTQKQQSQILLLSVAGLVLLILLGVLSVYLKNKKREAHQQQQLTKAIVQAEEAERKRIASDLHDGVGQLFSAVKMNLAGLIDRIDLPKEEDQFLAEKTLALVDESCKEVRVISHKMMPNFLLKSGIASDIRSFIEKIDESTLKIHFETKGFKEQLEFNEEVILYRVIQELIGNVIKHAQANELYLHLEKTDKQIQVQVTDNGLGFNYDNAIAKGGLGLKNILVRIEYLKGTISFTPNQPTGTAVKINIPIA